MAQRLRLHPPASLQLHSGTRHDRHRNEGINIDNTGSNIIRPALTGSAPVRLDRSSARRSSEKRRRETASTDRATARRTTSDAFVVEVKRRLSSARDNLLRRLGLYTELDEMPLGLIIDVRI